MVVDFRATFDEEVSDDQALSVLKNVVKDGKLGSFNISSTSVKSIAPTAQPESKEPTKGRCLSTRIEKKKSIELSFFSQKLYPSGNSTGRVF